MKRTIFTFFITCSFTISFAQNPPIKIGGGYKAFRYVVDSKGKDSLVYQPAPLVIVDGKEQQADILNYIKTEDISKMSIPNNHSYGEKGKRGVIIVTTKSGIGKYLKYTDKNN